MTRLFFFLAVLFAGAGAGAQTAPNALSALERAGQAYAERRFPDALSELTRALAAEPDNAEARYLLARVHHDPQNPQRNVSRADAEIRRAVALDPENLLYLVAYLEVLRSDSWSFIVDLVRSRQRLELADKILRIDPENAFAHEELGEHAIRDYYQYRNAIALPGLAFQSLSVNGLLDASQYVEFENVVDQSGVSTARLGPATLTDPNLLFPGNNSVRTSDRFDLDAMGAQGVTPISLSRRADRTYEAAIRHLRAAVVSDPRRRSVYDHIVRLAAISGTWEAIIPDLGEMYVQFPDDPEMWRYTGLANQRMGQYEAADLAFREAIRRMPNDEREAFTDLTMLLPPEEWEAYRADREAFAQRYWTSRDPRFLNGVNERRTEHYARLTEADLLFAADDLSLPGWQTQRGKLFVRYGPPERDVIIEGDFAFILEQFADRPIEFETNQFFQIASRYNVWDYGDMRFVFEDPSRKSEFRLYAPPADVFGLISARDVASMDYVQRTAEIIRETPEQYRFVAPGRQVQLPYRVTAFKGEGGQTDLYVNYGIPLGEADGASSGDVDVTVKTGAFLIGPARDLLVERRRTVYGLRGAQIVPFKETRLWTSTEQLSARPTGPHEVSLEFETSSGGTSAVQRRTIDIPDFSGDGLALSDILLAYLIEEEDRPSPGRVFRNGMSVQPAPWGVFGVDDPVYLYVEMYGLALREGRSDYELEARLEPKDTSRGLARVARRLLGRRDRGVSSAFEGDGGQTDDWRDLILDASAQAPGLYTLTVTVRDRVSGRTAEQQTDLLLE